MRIASRPSLVRSADCHDTKQQSTRLSSVTGKISQQHESCLVVNQGEGRRLFIHEADQIEVDNPSPKAGGANGAASHNQQNNDQRIRINERIRYSNKPDDRSKKVIRIKKNIKRETKTTRVCIIVSSIFIICCLPSAIFQVTWQIVD